jgi:hypothetical protein
MRLFVISELLSRSLTTIRRDQLGNESLPKVAAKENGLGHF